MWCGYFWLVDNSYTMGRLDKKHSVTANILAPIETNFSIMQGGIASLKEAIILSHMYCLQFAKFAPYSLKMHRFTLVKNSPGKLTPDDSSVILFRLQNSLAVSVVS